MNTADAMRRSWLAWATEQPAFMRLVGLAVVVSLANVPSSPWVRRQTGQCPPGVETVPGTWCRPINTPTRQERLRRRLQEQSHDDTDDR